MRDGGCGVGWDEVGWHGGRMGGGYCNRGGEQVGCVTELTQDRMAWEVTRGVERRERD